MTGLNSHLAAVLDEATKIQEGRSPRPSADKALKNAAMNYIEKDLGLPVMVKYGDAEVVRDNYGQSMDRVWDGVPDGNYTVFYVEPDVGFSPAVEAVQDVMGAIGAWYVGRAAVGPQEGQQHAIYVWPNDHPVLEYLPVPE